MSMSPHSIVIPSLEGGQRAASLVGLGRAELGRRLRDHGVPERQIRMRVRQLWSWLYVRGETSFAGMTDIAKELRGELAEVFTLDRPEIVTEQVSVDGTRKWLLRLADGKEVETVYIPEEDRGTLCISSQVGCTLTCSFCHTGTQRLVRNLTAGEIVGQIILARDRIGDWPGAEAEDKRGLPGTERKITNVVLMGMGEPLYNFDNVRDACLVAADGEGLSLSKRRITLSTSGYFFSSSSTASSTLLVLAVEAPSGSSIWIITMRESASGNRLKPMPGTSVSVSANNTSAARQVVSGRASARCSSGR